MVLILLIVNGTFVLCWLPYLVGAFCLTFTGGSCPFPDNFFIITTTLAMLNSQCRVFAGITREAEAGFRKDNSHNM